MFLRLKPTKYRDSVPCCTRRWNKDNRCKKPMEQRDGGAGINSTKRGEKEGGGPVKSEHRKSGSVGRRAMTGADPRTRDPGPPQDRAPSRTFPAESLFQIKHLRKRSAVNVVLFPLVSTNPAFTCLQVGAMHGDVEQSELESSVAENTLTYYRSLLNCLENVATRAASLKKCPIEISFY